MAFALVNSFFSATAQSGSAVSMNPLTFTAGNIVAVFVTYTSSGTVGSLGDDTGGSHVYVIAPGSQVTNGGVTGEIWYAKNVAGGSNITLTLSMTAVVGQCSISMLQFSGGATGAPFDKASTGTSNSSGAASCSSITPAGSGELSVSFIGTSIVGTAFTGTTGTGYTSPDNSGQLWGEYNLSVSTGQIGDWSTNVVQSYFLCQALFSTTDIVAGGSGLHLLAATGVGN